MAIVQHEIPEIVTISYRQEKSDKDYGSCLWARFNFDTTHYSMSIESDCGNYSYGWVPTPLSETFIHLCSRFDCEYLLYKISDRTVVDADATWKALKEAVNDTLEYFDSDCLDEYDWECLENACYHNRDDRDAFDSITSVLDDTRLSGKYEMEDILCAIQKDYPVNAKKIVEIFRDHIQPELRKLSGYKPRKDVL